MADTLARHDALVDEIVRRHGGQVRKTRGEGDSTFSVFDRPSPAAAAAAQLLAAIGDEVWPIASPLRIRVSLHTGEVQVRDGDFFGRAVNRAARLRSWATGGQIVLSRATADLVVDSLPEGTRLVDRGTHTLRDLDRPEHVFGLVFGAASGDEASITAPPSLERPPLPGGLDGGGPFVGRELELEQLAADWATTLAARRQSGVRRRRARRRQDPARRRMGPPRPRGRRPSSSTVAATKTSARRTSPSPKRCAPCVRTLGARRLQSVRGVEELALLVPELGDVVPDLAPPTQADPDTGAVRALRRARAPDGDGVGRGADRARTRRPPMGGQAHAPDAAPRPAHRRRGEGADRRHLPQHRSRPHPSAGRDARRPAPRRIRRSHLALGAGRARREHVRGRRRVRRRPPRARALDRHLRQPVLPHRGAPTRRRDRRRMGRAHVAPGCARSRRPGGCLGSPGSPTRLCSWAPWPAASSRSSWSSR